MNKLKVLVEKVNNMLEQMGDFSRGINEMKMLENIVTQLKKAFGRLSSIHGIAKKWISGLHMINKNYAHYNTKEYISRKNRIEHFVGYYKTI